jgi:D,D-heptose 1,7-bisphosphate phosphatase
MTAVIMAGGRGTRLGSLTDSLPKPLVRIDGIPILEREIDCLRSQGFTDIVLTVSYLGEMIEDYFGDGSKLSPITGEPFGVHISYFFEKEPLGNAGALFRIKDRLTDDFLLLNADSLFEVDFDRFVAFHKEKGALASLFTHPNSHPYDSGLIIADSSHSVLQWLSKEDARPQWYKNRVNAGLHILSRRLLDTMPDTPKIDLDRQLLKPLQNTGKMFSYDSPEYVKDMGTPERFAQVEKDLRNGIPQAKNLRNRQKAVFLDRDGTINRYVGFLTDIGQFELLPGVSEAIKAINQSGYLAIVATNQPVIARGEVTFSQLDEIHDKMETLLGRDGAYLDGIYFCPHHPDRGFPGEVPELKIDCDCRKPKPGMLLKAARDFNIDLSQSYMVGDDDKDVLTGRNAGCKESFRTSVKFNLNDIIIKILGHLYEQ